MCNICKQKKPTVFVTTIENGKNLQLDICGDCARGIATPFGAGLSSLIKEYGSARMAPLPAKKIG